MNFKQLQARILISTVEWRKELGSLILMILKRQVIRQKPDGTDAKPFSFYIFDRGNAVCAIVHLKDTDQIILVRQYRAGVNKYLLEIPAGMVDSGEDPAEAVVREVEEEVGFDYQKIAHVFHFIPSGGGCTEELDLFYIQTTSRMKTSSGGGKLGESEEIEVITLDVNEAISLMHKGEITDGKTIMALLWLENLRSNM